MFIVEYINVGCVICLLLFNIGSIDYYLVILYLYLVDF